MKSSSNSKYPSFSGPHFSGTLISRFRLIGSITLLTILSLAAYSTNHLDRTSNSIDDLMDEFSSELLPITSTIGLLLELPNVINNYRINGKTEYAQEFKQISNEINLNFETILDAAGQHTYEVNKLIKAKNIWGHIHKTGLEIISSPNNPNNNSINNYSDNMRLIEKETKQTSKILWEILDIEYQEMLGHKSIANQHINKSITISALILAITILVTIIAYILLVNKILIPLGKVEKSVKVFGSGDLKYRAKVNGDNEVASLASTFNTMADKLEDIATHDGLTKLINYREFNKHLGLEIKRYQRNHSPFSLLLIDVDHFKRVNDTHGHLTGDKALVYVANTILNEVRLIDHAARYGGEEFSIILPGTDKSEAAVIAERIRSQIDQFSFFELESVNITVSIGISTYPEDSDSAEGLIDASDQAMYAAKASGRNKLIKYNKEMYR